MPLTEGGYCEGSQVINSQGVLPTRTAPLRHKSWSIRSVYGNNCDPASLQQSTCGRLASFLILEGVMSDHNHRQNIKAPVAYHCTQEPTASMSFGGKLHSRLIYHETEGPTVRSADVLCGNPPTKNGAASLGGTQPGDRNHLQTSKKACQYIRAIFIQGCTRGRQICLSNLRSSF